MEKESKYLVFKGTEYILKKQGEKLTCLLSKDIEDLNLKEISRTENGVSEENNETIYTLYTIETSGLSAKLSDCYEVVNKEELFSKPLYPWERLFLEKMVKGDRNIHLISTHREDKLVTAFEEVHFPWPVAFVRHLHTINTHRRYVRKHCFKVGLFWQGLIHDLSKYSPAEFFVGVKYYQGSRSPNVAERCHIGYSSAWMHHKGRNKHHHEYWTDYDPQTGNPIAFKEMPKRYFIESIMDRIAACKVYRKKSYTDSAALDYLLSRDSEAHMNPKNHEEMIRLLTYLSEHGEKEFFRYIKNEYLK